MDTQDNNSPDKLGSDIDPYLVRTPFGYPIHGSTENYVISFGSECIGTDGKGMDGESHRGSGKETERRLDK